jgi:hypothetical protein
MLVHNVLHNAEHNSLYYQIQTKYLLNFMHIIHVPTYCYICNSKVFTFILPSMTSYAGTSE